MFPGETGETMNFVFLGLTVDHVDVASPVEHDGQGCSLLKSILEIALTQTFAILSDVNPEAMWDGGSQYHFSKIEYSANLDEVGCQTPWFVVFQPLHFWRVHQPVVSMNLGMYVPR